jgi:hypothetical protein
MKGTEKFRHVSLGDRDQMHSPNEWRREGILDIVGKNARTIPLLFHDTVDPFTKTAELASLQKDVLT